jgi:hypothetical protein
MVQMKVKAGRDTLESLKEKHSRTRRHVFRSKYDLRFIRYSAHLQKPRLVGRGARRQIGDLLTPNASLTSASTYFNPCKTVRRCPLLVEQRGRSEGHSSSSHLSSDWTWPLDLIVSYV